MYYITFVETTQNLSQASTTIRPLPLRVYYLNKIGSTGRKKSYRNNMKNKAVEFCHVLT